MLSKRSSGILLHPSSLPSRGGIGDFGPAAYEFVDWLAAAKQTLWQVFRWGLWASATRLTPAPRPSPAMFC